MPVHALGDSVNIKYPGGRVRAEAAPQVSGSKHTLGPLGAPRWLRAKGHSNNLQKPARMAGPWLRELRAEETLHVLH